MAEIYQDILVDSYIHGFLNVLADFLISHGRVSDFRVDTDKNQTGYYLNSSVFRILTEFIWDIVSIQMEY